ncbi:MAG: branched-chain amino acid aminotransferase [Gammaproteobacteria bacterium]|nr:branched-chain amino acid aminotransferase [Gammaproteobacteria bacterium]
MSGFGSQFAPSVMRADHVDGRWSEPMSVASDQLVLHPASHVLHYASSCFEGLKAFRGASGGAHLFRPDMHIQRLQNSARYLCLPVPDADMVMAMLRQVVSEHENLLPEYPGALYLRPLLFASDINIGSAGHASSNAILLVMASPVGDYFGGQDKTLRLFVETEHARTTPDFGQVKTGGNYAAALQHVLRARREQACDQVLFCPNDDVQETGAANFFLLHDRTLITKHLDGSILPGVTRDSLLQVAADLGLQVEQRALSVAELLEKAPEGEAFLSGTAAVITAVGELVSHGDTIVVGNGGVGGQTRSLRETLVQIQSGCSDAHRAWLVECCTN